MSAREAADAGIEVVAETTEGRTRAGYYPGAARAAVKVVAARATGRMLGAQIVAPSLDGAIKVRIPPGTNHGRQPTSVERRALTAAARSFENVPAAITSVSLRLPPG